MLRIARIKRWGFITPMTVMAVIFLFIIGLSLLLLGFNRRMTAIRANRHIAARSAADYGLVKAIYEMNQRLMTGNWDDTLPSECDSSVPGGDALYSYAVTGNIAGYAVHASGKRGLATRNIYCDLKLKGPFEHAILTRTTMDLISKSLVDQFNYDDDDPMLKIGTTSIQPGAIVLKSGCVINGDLLIGQGGIPSVVVDNQGATVRGTVYAVTTDYDMVIPQVPASLADATSRGTIRNPITITTSGRYDAIRLNNGGTLTINGDVELYVTGNITLDNSARIDVSPDNPDARLTIYLGGTLDGLNASGFNNLSRDPRKLRVYGLPSCHSVIIKNNAVFYGVIYAPNADVDMHNSAEIYGSVVANSYIQRNSATFWYDASLRDVTVTDSFIRFVPTHWREE